MKYVQFLISVHLSLSFTLLRVERGLVLGHGLRIGQVYEKYAGSGDHREDNQDREEQCIHFSFLRLYEAFCAQLLQSCPTLCNPMDCSPPGSSVHGILQASILEWVAISFSYEAF